MLYFFQKKKKIKMIENQKFKTRKTEKKKFIL